MQNIFVNLSVKERLLALLVGPPNDKTVTKGAKYIPCWTINFRPNPPFCKKKSIIVFIQITPDMAILAEKAIFSVYSV